MALPDAGALDIGAMGIMVRCVCSGEQVHELKTCIWSCRAADCRHSGGNLLPTAGVDRAVGRFRANGRNFRRRKTEDGL